MGSSNQKSTKGQYTFTEFDEETEIRAFELEIGGFRKKLNSVLPGLCIERNLITITSLENYISTVFSPEFVKLIQYDFFYRTHNEVKYYDAKKIKYLLFLLTTDSMLDNSKVKYHDKV